MRGTAGFPTHDFVTTLRNYIVSYSCSSSKPIGHIVQEILDREFGDDVRTDFIDDGPSVTVHFTFESVFTILERLAKMAGFEWGIDAQDRFWFGRMKTMRLAQALIKSNILPRRMKQSRDMSARILRDPWRVFVYVQKEKPRVHVTLEKKIIEMITLPRSVGIFHTGMNTTAQNAQMGTEKWIMVDEYYDPDRQPPASITGNILLAFLMKGEYGITEELLIDGWQPWDTVNIDPAVIEAYKLSMGRQPKQKYVADYLAGIVKKQKKAMSHGHRQQTPWTM